MRTFLFYFILFFFFYLFIFFFSCFSLLKKDGNLFWVYENGNFLPGKSISRREQNQEKWLCPLRKICLLHHCGWVQILRIKPVASDPLLGRGSRGWSAPLRAEKMPKIMKKREEKRDKSGKRGKISKLLSMPLLTDRAGYATE